MKNQNTQKKILCEIQRRGLDAGDKIPTEKYFSEKYKVSRTTIRNAISELKGRGVLTSRQGAGVFIAQQHGDNTHRLPPASHVYPSLSTSATHISNAVSMLELRIPVETEIIKFAVARKSPEQEVTIIQAFNAFKHKVHSNAESTTEDFAFHLAIAKATNNPKMVEFVLWAGKNSIPRNALHDKDRQNIYKDNYATLVEEHEKIVLAICDNNTEQAVAMMRHHLMQSLNRYKKLLHSQNNAVDF